MFPAKRPYCPNQYTSDALNKLPGWMRARLPESVFYRYFNSIYGYDLDLLARTLIQYKSYCDIVSAPIDSIAKLYSVDIDYYFASGYITTTDGAFKVYPVNEEIEFLSNPITRLESEAILFPSGVNGQPLTHDIVGMEYIISNPTGILAIQLNEDPAEPSSTLYYSLRNIDNYTDVVPYSGDALGLATLGLGKNSSYDILQPELPWSLRKKYPDNAWISPTGYTSNPSGVWYRSYLDEDGNKIYHWMTLNNPYGSGSYQDSDADLSFVPMTGTLKIYDIMNLTADGVPYEIPNTGKQVYKYTDVSVSGVWEYVGYDSPIPESKTPKYLINRIKEANNDVFTPITPSAVFITSWQVLQAGGYVDDEVYPHSGTFNWIVGSGVITNTIRFRNPMSKYQAEYSYRLYDTVKQLSNDPKNLVSSVSNPGSIYFISGSGYYRAVEVENSISDGFAFRTHPDNLRPGSTAKVVVTSNSKYATTWTDARNTDKTIQFVRHNIGYTDELGLRDG